MDSRTKALCDFLNAAHSVYHAQAYLAETLKNAGYTRLYEQDEWALAPGGKYFLTRGGSAIVAKAFGEGKREKGNQYFSLFVYVSAALGVVFAGLGIAFVRPIARLLGAEGELLENAVLYARIILIALPFNVLQLLFQSFCVTAKSPSWACL